MENLWSTFANFFTGGIPNLGGNASGTIWNHDNGYDVPSTSETANSFEGSFMDPFGAVAGLYNDLTGVTEQSREFSQQEHLAQQAREWEVTGKYEALRSVGVNPNVIAAGLAGNNASSVPQVPAGSGGASSGLGSIAQAADAASTALNLNPALARKNNAEALNFEANTRNVDRLADVEVLSKAGSFAQSLTASGMPEIMAMELGLNIVRGGLDGLSSFMQGLNVCRKIDYESDLIQVQFENEMKDLDLKESQIRLNGAYVDEANQHAALMEIEGRRTAAETEMIRKKNSLWDSLGTDPNLNDFQRLYEVLQKYGEDSPQFQALLNAVKDLYYNQGLGTYSAENEYAYSIASKKAFAEAYASWYKAQSGWAGLVDKLAMMVRNYGVEFRDGLATDPEKLAELTRDAQFRSAYNKFRDDLKAELEAARKEYRYAKRYYGSDAIPAAYNRYQNALRAYEECTEENFLMSLLQSPADQ